MNDIQDSVDKTLSYEQIRLELMDWIAKDVRDSNWILTPKDEWIKKWKDIIHSRIRKERKTSDLSINIPLFQIASSLGWLYYQNSNVVLLEKMNSEEMKSMMSQRTNQSIKEESGKLLDAMDLLNQLYSPDQSTSSIQEELIDAIGPLDKKPSTPPSSTSSLRLTAAKEKLDAAKLDEDYNELQRGIMEMVRLKQLWKAWTVGIKLRYNYHNSAEYSDFPLTSAIAVRANNSTISKTIDLWNRNYNIFLKRKQFESYKT